MNQASIDALDEVLGVERELYNQRLHSFEFSPTPYNGPPESDLDLSLPEED